MTNARIEEFIRYLRDDPGQLDFRAGRLVYRPTGERIRVGSTGAFRTAWNGPQRSGGFASFAVFDALFRIWYDDYWRPARIDEVLANYRAPDNAIEHWLRKMGWRRGLRVLPTADEVVGLPPGTRAGSALSPRPDPGSVKPSVPHDKPHAA